MKILMVTGDYPPMKKGVGDYAFHVSKNLRKQVADLQVVTTHNEASDCIDLLHLNDVHREILNWRIRDVFKILKHIPRKIDKIIINIQYYCPSTYGRRLMINFLPLVLRLLRPRCRIVVTMHGFWEQSILFRLRTFPMLRASHGIIYVDRQNAKLLQRYSGKSLEKLKYVPIASNIIPVPVSFEEKKLWRQTLGFDDKSKVVSFFGAIGPPKGIDSLIKAIADLRNEKKYSLFLLLIGGFHTFKNDQYVKKIKLMINAPQVSTWVKVIQEPNAGDCSKWLQCSDLAVFPFVHGVAENSGSTLAALAHQLPTIVTEGPNGSYDFYDKLGAYVIPTNSTEKLAECIGSVLNLDPHRVDARKKKCDNKQLTTWSEIADETVNFFSSIL